MVGLKYFLNPGGGQIIGLDKREAKKWQEAVAPVIADYVEKENKSKGSSGSRSR